MLYTNTRARIICRFSTTRPCPPVVTSFASAKRPLNSPGIAKLRMQLAAAIVICKRLREPKAVDIMSQSGRKFSFVDTDRD